MALYARYCRIGNESVRLKLEEIPEGLDIEFAYVGVSRHSFRQITEFQLATVVKVCRFVTGLNLRPIRVAFAHARNSDPKPFAQFFGCGVEFAAASDRIAFSRDALCAPLVTEDHYLLETLRPFCDEAAKTRHTTAGTLRHAVENEIQRLLPHGNARAETVAKSLGLSLRTLSRRLAEEQTSFAEIVDHLRRSLAQEYLKEPDFALAQIAWLLGYERTSSFHHAHKRWTGHSPNRARPCEQRGFDRADRGVTMLFHGSGAPLTGRRSQAHPNRRPSAIRRSAADGSCSSTEPNQRGDDPARPIARWSATPGDRPAA